ncbi:MAG: hypothetical protein HON68_03135 [Gammaproteobacteria bacterium]|nr:hypothetical protein [Gammaproteobacteria bacterium]MBT4132011.1 hypothetical protein [Candidatus Neomarinimicrobiota bacterium]MBT4330810.1 hypothetical protein [Gammaproteobacteria bacterium]MBT4788106.1 hypothetical protein [Gammaproteobacteria bacterium]MBT5370713.1 hypothetical protein [Gammaproteobacteria bacterium]
MSRFKIKKKATPEDALQVAEYLVQLQEIQHGLSVVLDRVIPYKESDRIHLKIKALRIDLLWSGYGLEERVHEVLGITDRYLPAVCRDDLETVKNLKKLPHEEGYCE